MKNIVIFGAPGSGKGTQSEKLIARYGLTHISTGEILRAEIKADTELGRLANSFMSQGHLVPDDIVIGILREIISKNKDIKGFIFDGFPRTLEQGRALRTILDENKIDITAVISLEVDKKTLIDRLINRGKLTGRADDTLETIESRLRVYEKQTEPLKEFYANKGKLHLIKGEGTVDSIFESIVETVDKL